MELENTLTSWIMGQIMAYRGGSWLPVLYALLGIGFYNYLTHNLNRGTHGLVCWGGRKIGQFFGRWKSEPKDAVYVSEIAKLRQDKKLSAMAQQLLVALERDTAISWNVTGDCLTVADGPTFGYKNKTISYVSVEGEQFTSRLSKRDLNVLAKGVQLVLDEMDRMKADRLLQKIRAGNYTAHGSAKHDEAPASYEVGHEATPEDDKLAPYRQTSEPTKEGNSGKPLNAGPEAKGLPQFAGWTRDGTAIPKTK